jgi:hypothetical protein
MACKRRVLAVGLEDAVDPGFLTELGVVGGKEEVGSDLGLRSTKKASAQEQECYGQHPVVLLT